ncbi:SH3 domain-containing protein [Paenibacillus sp. GSMTC-2017]|uniref:SH3 domain-containing protein n=1 Tax=Paenibacillus sp. GSMTC-2017 TaxID=2794350 RepID=UPI0018D940C6|nr:SH3 domain-containing protein [Paenibacillus sp. GSMTC-2017]MBH5316369.1 SH3 domain-containing protein [Paenibacillus sp. GSMTC-2017]
MAISKKWKVTVIAAIVSLLFATSIYAAAGWYQVNTNSGSPVNLRTGPGTGFGIVVAVPSGQDVYVDCYKNGQTVTGKYGTSNIWNLAYYNGYWGYISDTYVNTGSDGPVVPRC